MRYCQCVGAGDDPSQYGFRGTIAGGGKNNTGGAVMDFKERLDGIMTAAREAERKIAGMGAELVPQVRDIRQKEERARILANLRRQIAEFRLTVEKRQREVERGIREAAYPMLSSASAVDRTVGSAEYSSAQGFGTVFPSEEYVAEHWGLQRYDYLTALAERAHFVQGQNTDGIHERQRFLRQINELFSERWKELPQEQKAIQGVMQRLTWIEGNLAAGQIGAVPVGEYPGSNVPSVLTQ